MDSSGISAAEETGNGARNVPTGSVVARAASGSEEATLEEAAESKPSTKSNSISS